MKTKEKILEEICNCKNCHRFRPKISWDHVTPCPEHTRMIFAYFFEDEKHLKK